MSLELLGITVLWIFLFGYVIVASIDFGAGFFSMYSDISGRKDMIHTIIQRYLSPVWEITNVFLVFFFVGIVGFFPKTAFYYGTALLIPGSISIILLAIRGSYYAFGTYGMKNNRILTFLYGMTGVFIPASLSTVLIISEGGFISVKGKHVKLHLLELLTSPFAWSVVLLAIVSVLFISASFLTWYSSKANDYKAGALLRKYTLAWSLPSVLSALVVVLSMKTHNPEHFENMIQYSWMLILSILFFFIAVFFFYRKKHYGAAFLSVVLQYALAFFAYGTSHYPYLLYPYLTVQAGFTNETMAKSLVIVFILGLLLLVPSFLLVLKLFVFDKNYIQGK
ncbi:cytochrome d ubiquinol oxidase subunit II [Mesobacillus zeae]|uniref:Cytochrome d ubiquinol oxidase subunit II n=1 Tax=Mesobacillus zeae TaxID=1917180 RepID=A0A398B6Z8_9BACI|nr:cytochrome d ubiquinol oxidase subunit II [Mesobacillus zeae]RID85567.1 cytochrome d ubiquinol oxidase subunit II [Mesobacillus zeae]